MLNEVALPIFHPRQAEIFWDQARYNAVRCGRRWGKTKQMVTLAADAALKGKKVGLFTPEHKQLNEPFEELLYILSPVKLRANKNEGTIRTTTGGLIDFWTLNDNELAGRGREYDLIMIDEAAFTKNTQMMGIWERSIKPTMLTRRGSRAWVFSTPNGDDVENFFWRVCNDEQMGFREHYAPTSSCPYVPPEELEKEREKNHPLVFRQEFLAEFVDFSGEAFFTPEKLTIADPTGELDSTGKVKRVGVEYPNVCNSVFAVIDSAVKSGREHDGTAVIYCATPAYKGLPLVCLDWEILSIDGALLEKWIPGVYKKLGEFVESCHARLGSKGVFIEDAQSGSILLQQCKARNLQATALPADLTAAGKDGRAMNASGPVFRGEVKWSRPAAKKEMSFKGVTRNHMLSQVYGFRIGDKSAATRSDDLFDTFVYSVAITLGDRKGIA